MMSMSIQFLVKVLSQSREDLNVPISRLGVLRCTILSTVWSVALRRIVLGIVFQKSVPLMYPLR
jgi:hypothetical protein